MCCFICSFTYNDGKHGLFNLFEKLNISAGVSFLKYCVPSDNKRIAEMDKNCTVEVQNKRKIIRVVKKN